MGECVQLTPDLYGGTTTCEELFNCCDCGERENGCGCAYCWTCNACEECSKEVE